MSAANAKTGIARRPFLASVLGIFGIAIAGGAVYEGARVFGRRYPRTKFDDLLDQLPDRESAAKLGHAALAQTETNIPLPSPAAIAREMRTGASGGSVAKAVDADITQGRLVTIQGWLLPMSLVEVATIAASVQPSAA